MLVVIYPDLDIWNFVLHNADFESKEIQFIPLNRYCNKFQRLVRQVFSTHQVPSWSLFGKELRQLLSSLCEGDSLLICDYTGENIIKTVRSIIKPNVKFSIWYWNPILGNPQLESQIECAKALECNIFTFNQLDAEKYNINLLNQFFPMFLEKKDVLINSDFYFQGYNKGRMATLEGLQSNLSKYNAWINIVENSSEVITYSEYIDNIRQTRCLIDIVQAGQCGITLRPLEALSLGKKLLTNNQNIVNYNFYRKENIFILGIDDIETIDSFLITPMVEIDNRIKYEYSTETWINNFL